METITPPRPVSLLENRYTASLRRQQRALARPTDVLRIVCPESPHEGVRGDGVGPEGSALVLETPGATVDGVGMGAALRTAVLHLGIRRIVVVGHGDCAHVGCSAHRPPVRRTIDERGTGVYARMVGRMVRARERLDLVRQRVREAVARIEATPALGARVAEGSLEVVGGVVVPSSGTTVWLDPLSGRFAPRLAGPVTHAVDGSNRALG